MAEFLFRFREPISAFGAVMAMLLFLLLLHLLPLTPAHPAASPSMIELTLTAPEISPLVEQKTEPRFQPTPPPIQHGAAQAIAHLQDAASPGNIVAAPVDPAAHVGTATAITGMPAPAAQESLAPVAHQETPMAAPSAKLADAARDLEAVYAGKIRAYLQSIKRYPTGREASLQRPAGTAVVWFTLRRSGELVEAGIETTSGSMLLDNTALATIRRSLYPVFPEEAWPGKMQQRFMVELNYVPLN